MRRSSKASRLATLSLSALLVGGLAAAPVASAAPPPTSTASYRASSEPLATSGTRGKVNAREMAKHPRPRHAPRQT